MSAIAGVAERGTEPPHILESDEAQRYFEAIEAMFSRLRGSALQMSPADRALAVAWFERGIPLELVTSLVPELLAKRRERNPKARWNSLRYCAPKVEAAWEEVEALQAAGRSAPAPALDVRARLKTLAGLLPEDLPRREVWHQRLLALDGSSQAVEDALARLDDELLRELEVRLAPAARQDLETRLAATLTQLAARLPAAELEAARARLLVRELRRLFHLPLLTLFAPELESEPG